MLAQRLWGDESMATAFNFGPVEVEAPPAGTIVGRLCELWGDGLRWEGQGGDHPHEAGLLRLDSSRAAARLGWHPTWDIDEALVRIVEWFRAYADGQDVRKATVAQIEDFLAAPPRR